jgi:hypothetical protein
MKRRDFITLATSDTLKVKTFVWSSSTPHNNPGVTQGQFRSSFVEKSTSSARSISLRWQLSSPRRLACLC